MPYSVSTACFSDSGTLRMELVLKPGAQSTDAVRPDEYAPGEQRRSGSGPRTHPDVRVRLASRTVRPTEVAGAAQAASPAPSGTRTAATRHVLRSVRNHPRSRYDAARPAPAAP